MIEAAFSARAASTAELKTSKSGKPWCAFGAAVSNGADTSDVTWVRVSVFGDLAQQVSEKLQKGDKLYCEGRLTLQTYTGRDGVERTGLQLAAHHVTRMGPKANKPERRKQAPHDAAGAERDWQAPSAHRPIANPEHESDRIPF